MDSIAQAENWHDNDHIAVYFGCEDKLSKQKQEYHTGQCKRTGGCYNELVVAFYSTGGGVKGKKSIPVDFIIYL